MARPVAEEGAEARLRRTALALAVFTIVYNLAEGVVAVAAGLVADSIALVGFGVDSGIEVFAAAVVLWRLRGLAEERERRALRLIAVSFFLLATYVAVESATRLAGAEEPATSAVGIALAVASLVVMPALGLSKRRVGRRLGSSVVVADGAETLLCAQLSAVLLVGLVVNATVGWWWADPLAALLIAALAVREGREAWEGGDHDHDHDDGDDATEG